MHHSIANCLFAWLLVSCLAYSIVGHVLGWFVGLLLCWSAGLLLTRTQQVRQTLQKSVSALTPAIGVSLLVRVRVRVVLFRLGNLPYADAYACEYVDTRECLRCHQGTQSSPR